MISIKVDVDFKECSFSFESLTENNRAIWTGKSEEFPKEEIIVEDYEGEPILFSSVSLSSGITTSREVVFERFLDEIQKLEESQRAGLEVTEEEHGKNEMHPYDPEAIKVRREIFSLFEINRMMSAENDIDLNPDFQRNLVWDNARKSSLIESILLGIPIPVFYFAESKNGIYHVVDGLQRLSTIKQFLNNEFPLKKLEHLKHCEGKYYKEDLEKPKTKGSYLERKFSRRLENAQLNVNVIESSSPSMVKYDIFKRLNTGGRPLNHQEVRNCIAESKVRKYLKSLAQSKEFIQATGNSISDYRMDAQELVLRFTGFKLEKEGKLIYSSDMNCFLNDTLDIINDYSDAKLLALEDQFLKSMRINYHLFGRYCFRKCLSEHLDPKAKKQYINKALFVTWSTEVLNLNEEEITATIEFESFAKTLAQQLDNRGKYYTILTTGTSDKQNLKEAAEFARRIITENIYGF